LIGKSKPVTDNDNDDHTEQRTFSSLFSVQLVVCEGYVY